MELQLLLSYIFIWTSAVWKLTIKLMEFLKYKLNHMHALKFVLF